MVCMRDGRVSGSSDLKDSERTAEAVSEVSDDVGEGNENGGLRPVRPELELLLPGFGGKGT